MRSYQAVIWDWNGTLLDDVGLCLLIVNELLADHGVPSLSSERYREIFDFPARLYWERAGLDLSRVDFQTISSRFCERFEDQLRETALHPDAASILSSVREFGIAQYLVSNTEQAALIRLVEYYELSGHFEALQGMPNTLAEGKLAAGSSLIHDFSLDPDTTLMVGDTIHDAEVARELGVDCVLVASGHQARSRLEGLGCPVVDSLSGLQPVLGA